MRALGYLVDMSVLDRGACVGQVGHQRASLSLPPACAGEGNILWDCITMLDEDTKAHLHELGGVRAIAISHPHFYSRMAAWADEFDARVYAHADDRRWVMQPSKRVTHWTGTGPGPSNGCEQLRCISIRRLVQLMRCGGRASALHGTAPAEWPAAVQRLPDVEHVLGRRRTHARARRRPHGAVWRRHAAAPRRPLPGQRLLALAAGLRRARHPVHGCATCAPARPGAVKQAPMPWRPR